MTASCIWPREHCLLRSTASYRRLYFPSPGTDSWICSMLFSVLVMVRIVRIRVRLRLIELELGWGRKIAPVMYICPSRTENNTEGCDNLHLLFAWPSADNSGFCYLPDDASMYLQLTCPGPVSLIAINLQRVVYLPHPNPCFVLGSRFDHLTDEQSVVPASWGYRPLINPTPSLGK